MKRGGYPGRQSGKLWRNAPTNEPSSDEVPGGPPTSLSFTEAPMAGVLVPVIDCCTRAILGGELDHAPRALGGALRHRFGWPHGAPPGLTVRHDNGLVFGSRLYSSTAGRSGLRQEDIAPYTPEQNGLCGCFIPPRSRESSSSPKLFRCPESIAAQDPLRGHHRFQLKGRFVVSHRQAFLKIPDHRLDGPDVASSGDR